KSPPTRSYGADGSKFLGDCKCPKDPSRISGNTRSAGSRDSTSFVVISSRYCHWDFVTGGIIIHVLRLTDPDDACLALVRHLGECESLKISKISAKPKKECLTLQASESQEAARPFHRRRSCKR